MNSVSRSSLKVTIIVNVISIVIIITITIIIIIVIFKVTETSVKVLLFYIFCNTDCSSVTLYFPLYVIT